MQQHTWQGHYPLANSNYGCAILLSPSISLFSTLDEVISDVVIKRILYLFVVFLSYDASPASQNLWLLVVNSTTGHSSKHEYVLLIQYSVSGLHA